MTVTGRPSLCDAELTELMCSQLRQGVPLYVAAGCIGLGKSTMHRWMSDPKSPAEEHFREAVKRELAVGHRTLVQGIIGSGEWKGMAWILERTCPEQFAPPPARTEIGPPGAFDRSAPDAEVEAQLAEAQAILALPEGEPDGD